MRDDDLLTIGEVAKIDGVTTKALRYYDAHGILRPLVTDPHTGYRYYAPDQMIAMDVIRLCLEAGVPLDSIDSYHGPDGALDWRALMETGRSRVADDIARLRSIEVSLDDYLGEMTRKARTPDDGVVRSDLPSTWMVGSPWSHADAFDAAAYLRAMADLREATRAAGLPRLLRRGVLVDLVEDRVYAYQQFAPDCDARPVHSPIEDTSEGTMSEETASGMMSDGGSDVPPDGADMAETAVDHTHDAAVAARFDDSLAVFHPDGGEGVGVVIERATLSACFDEAFDAIACQREEGWRHVTVCEIWGSHAAHGSMRVRTTFHHCAAGRVVRQA